MEMDIKTAIAIFKDIYRTDGNVIEKKKAIKLVANMPTQNGIKKAEMMDVIRWMTGMAKREDAEKDGG